MGKLSFWALCALLTTIAGNAFAAPPPRVPGCERYGTDADRDGYCAVNLALPAPADPMAKKAFDAALGPVDCDDDSATVNPGANDVPGDGYDQDCFGGDRTYSADVVTFAKLSSCDIANSECMRILTAEMSACQAAGTDKCQLVLDPGVANRYKTKNGYKFVDRDCNGIREVISKTDFETFRNLIRAQKQDPNWEPRDDGRCIGGCYTSATTTCVTTTTCTTAGGCPKAGGAGAVAVRRAGPSPAQRKHESEQDEAIRVLREDEVRHTEFERNQVVTDRHQDDAIKVIKESDARQNDALMQLKKADEGQREALNGVVEHQAVTDNRQDIATQAAQATADEAKAATNIATNNGFSFELVLGFGVYRQGEIRLADDGEDLGLARGEWAPHLRLGLNLGYEMLHSRYLAMWRINPDFEEGPDGDTELGRIDEFGGAGEWEVLGDDHYLGLGVVYLSQASGGNVVHTNAVSNAILGQVRYTYHPDSCGATQSAYSAILAFGREEYGTDGEDVTLTEDAGFKAGLLFEAALGLGPVGCGSDTGT